MIDINIEDLIPHRDRMKLIDEILSVDENSAETASIVTEKWPLYENNSVIPIILIELVAQTAGINAGWNKMYNNGKNSGKGWLVGVKKASFFIDKIPLQSRIITHTEKYSSYSNFADIIGATKIGSNIIGEIELQVIGVD